MLKFATAVLAHLIFVIGANKWKLWNTALEFQFLEKDPSGMKVYKNFVLIMRHK